MTFRLLLGAALTLSACSVDTTVSVGASTAPQVIRHALPSSQVIRASRVPCFIPAFTVIATFLPRHLLI